MIDWGDGRYERTARQLELAACVAVDALAPRPGETVLDLGCGTGNVALLAAQRGAHVTGVDPAARLLDVARSRLAAEDLDAVFAAGDATALDFDDAAFDAAVSVFGVIFAAPAERAAAELVRVVRPGGRIVLTSWVAAGPINEAGRLTGRAMAESRGEEPSAPVNWGDEATLRQLFAPASVHVQERTIVFAAESVEAQVAAFEADHPFWRAARSVLEPVGRWEQHRARLLETFAAGNEDPAAFRTTSRYVLVIVRS